MTVIVVTGPAVEPITLAEAKTHLVIDADVTADDAYIAGLIVMARERLEGLTRRAYVQRTLEESFDGFGCQEFELQFPPLVSVESIKYTDNNGDEQTVDPSDYQVDARRQPALVKPAYLEYWPVLTRCEYNAVRIQYLAGYAPIGSPLDYRAAAPERAKHWMKARITTWYENRNPIVTGTIVGQLPRDYIDALLDDLEVGMF